MKDKKIVRLDSVATFSKGKGVSKIDVSEHGEFECIRYGELYTKYSENISTIYSRTDFCDSPVKSKIGDILIPSSGETAIDLATASRVDRENIILGGDINIISPNPEKVDSLFLSYQLNSACRNDISKLAQGSSVIHIYNESLKSLKIQLPLLKQQQKIGRLLSSMDQLIEYAQNQAHYTQIKKNFLSSMIFTNNNDASGFIKFESTVNYISSNLSMSSVTGYSNYPVYGANSIVGFTEKYISDKKYISIVKDGAGVGRTQKCDPKTNILGTMGAMTVNEGFDFDYIVQFLNSVKWDIYISGSTIPHLYFNDYKNLKLLTKTIDQQVKYGKLLSSMDQLSDLYKSYSENLLEQKKYNLNKIFS